MVPGAFSDSDDGGTVSHGGLVGPAGTTPSHVMADDIVASYVAGGVGPGGSAGSGGALRAAVVPDPDRAAPGDNASSWGPWSLSEIRRNHILVGYGANCNKHREPGCTVGCKRSLSWGKAFTPQEVKAKLKLWLLNGLDVPPGSTDYPRT
jgi:hypothetical protein